MPFCLHYFEKIFLCVFSDILKICLILVCLSNANKTQCKCENQYVWSPKQCSKHGVCGPIQNETCRCITSLPTDGTFCRQTPGKEESLYFQSKWQLMWLKKSDAGFDRWNIFVFVQICSSTEAIQIHHWHKNQCFKRSCDRALESFDSWTEIPHVHQKRHENFRCNYHYR